MNTDAKTLENKLKELGLADKEARVYLASLELGSDTVQNIAKKSGVNRATGPDPKFLTPILYN